MIESNTVNINDVCIDIFAGGDAPKKHMSLMPTDEYKVPIYSNGEANNGLYGYTDIPRVKKPCITVSARGTIGYVAVRTEPFVPIVRLITIIPNTDIIDLKYLYYAVGNYNFSNNGTSIPQLTVPMIKKHSFPLYDMKTQKNIANKLDKLTDLINKRKQQLQKLDELVKARFVEMFGDCDLSIGDKSWQRISCIGKVVGGATPKTNISEYWDGKYRWITPAELDADSGYIYDSERKLTKLGVDSCSLQELPVDTVILTSRAPIGKLAITGDTFYCNQGFKNIICGDKVLPMYLYYILLFNVDYLNSLGRGATFKEISKSIVENIKIPVPSIDRQNHFVTFIKQINKTKLTIQKSLDKLELLKKALMQEYFG